MRINLPKNSLIFDLDGTLWDSCDVVKEAWNQGIKNFGLDKVLKREDIEGTMGLAFAEIFDKLLPEVDFARQVQIGRMCEEIENELIAKSGGVLYPTVMEQIPLLSEIYDLYIVSNCQAGYIETFLKHSNLGSCFKGFLSHGQTKRPKGENIIALKKEHGINASLYIGDTISDWKACEFAKENMIFAGWGFGNIDDKNVKGQYSSFLDMAIDLKSNSNLYF